MALRGDYPEARNNLAMALLSQKAYKEAEAQVREALRLRSDYVDAQRNLGSVMSAMRRFEGRWSNTRKRCNWTTRVRISGWISARCSDICTVR